MRWIICVLPVLCCFATFSGCNSGKEQELRAEVLQIQAQLEMTRAEMEEIAAENARLKAESEAAQQQLDELQTIRQGYEEARAKFEENLSQLGPLLGTTGSPLPPFEELKNSEWVGKLMPAAGQLPGDLKELEGQLKGLLGDPAADAAPKPE